MPKVHNNYDDTVQYTSYKDENELPRNIKIFIKELRRNLGDNLKFDEYVVSKSLLSPEHEDYDEDDDGDSLDLEYDVDAEKYAKGDINFAQRWDIRESFQHLADALGIDNWDIYVRILNKKEFAEKFLKDLKKQMKLTNAGQYIHAIKFNTNSLYGLELVFVMKRNNWNRYSEVRDAARQVLDSFGYKNVSIHVP